MLLAILATLASLAILAWSANRFVMAAAAVSRALGMAPLLIGMVVIGLGTSAPEIMVSALAAAEGNLDLALGNALGSNIVNIGLVLGVTALVVPVAVHRSVVRREFPVLAAVTAVAIVVLVDRTMSRTDALILLAVLVVVTVVGILYGKKVGDDALGEQAQAQTESGDMTTAQAWWWLGIGLVVLVASSRLLVWGAVGIAERVGLSDLVIGLTVVAIGTSAPELASALAAARKGEGDLVLGNVLGSSIFNALAVVGIAGLIAPGDVPAVMVERDIPVLVAFTAALMIVGLKLRGQGRVNRIEGAALLLAFVAYTGYVLVTSA